MIEIEDDSTRRTVRVNTRLQPEVKARLDAIAADLGMPASTIAAFAISEYVQRKIVEKQALAGVFNAIPEMIQSVISGIELDDAKLASFVKALGHSREG